MNNPNDTPKLSVIVATHNRQAQLKRCIDSVYSSDFSNDFELIVVVNGKCERSMEILDGFAESHDNLIYFQIETSTLGATRNQGISKARGEILYFIDDDVLVPGENFSKIGDFFSRQKDVDILGGPNIAPKDSSRFQRYSGYALQTYFGAAKMRYRYESFGKNVVADERMLILCNLAIRSDSIKKSKVKFDDEVVRNEENILIQHMAAKGHKMIYMPDLIIFHDRRSDVRSFISQLFMYGRGRAQNIIKHPQTFSPLFIMPSMLSADVLLYLVTSYEIFYIPIIAYVIGDIISAVSKSFHERDPLSFLAILFLCPIAHFSYGLGFTYQLIKYGHGRVFSRV